MFTKHPVLFRKSLINSPTVTFQGWWPCAPQTHADYRGLGVDTEVEDPDPAVQAEIDAQRRYAEWLDENWQVEPGRRPKKRGRSCNRTYRQSAYNWIVELENLLLCPPHGGPGFVRWQVPRDWRSVKAKGSEDCQPKRPATQATPVFPKCRTFGEHH